MIGNTTRRESPHRFRVKTFKMPEAPGHPDPTGTETAASDATQAVDRMSNLLARIEELPPHQALRQAVRIIEEGSATKADENLELAIRLGREWLNRPQEPTRLKALSAAEHLEYSGIAGWLLAAVAWTRGSMADPRVADVPVPHGLSSKASAAAAAECLCGIEDEDARDKAVGRAIEQLPAESKE